MKIWGYWTTLGWSIVAFLVGQFVGFGVLLWLRRGDWDSILQAPFDGVLVTIFEGLLQLNQYHENWIRYRSTCESLKHEKYIYLAGAGPYAAAEKPRALLAERVESLVSQEHAKWATVQQQEPQTKPAS